MKINVAIIGLGVVGKKRREFIKNNNNYNLIAVSDILFKKNFIRNNVHYFKDFEDVFKMDNKLDAIFITLPNYLSSKVTILALKKIYKFFVKSHLPRIMMNF